jgi:glycosyltransferase involved in cell wall biosynthesis
LRILFVNYEYPPLGGGGGIVNAWLAEELAKRHEVSVLTSRAFDLPVREIIGNVEVIRSRTLFRRQRAAANIPSMATFVLSGTARGRALVRNNRYDIINTHFAIPTGPVGAYLSRLGNVPNVLSVHGGDLYDPSKWSSPHRHAFLRYVVRRVAQSADAVVGQSQNTNENLCNFFDSTAHPKLIPLGIPRPPPAKSDRAGLGIEPDEKILVSVGRLVRRKRTDQLIRLVNSLGDKKVRLIVIGNGPDLPALKRQAVELGVASQITFEGYVPDQRKVDLLAAADIYVSTSQHEGFGLVFLEAMAQGLPVVCYNHGGQTDYLQDGVNGALLPLNDFTAFESAVRSLVQNTDECGAISTRNRGDIESLFIDNCANQYEELFHEVIGRHS